MEKFTIPEVHPIHDGAFVTIPTKSWNALCETVNAIVEAVNAQTVAINGIQTGLTDCVSDIAKLAEVTEEIYETLE